MARGRGRLRCGDFRLTGGGQGLGREGCDQEVGWFLLVLYICPYVLEEDCCFPVCLCLRVDHHQQSIHAQRPYLEGDVRHGPQGRAPAYLMVDCHHGDGEGGGEGVRRW